MTHQQRSLNVYNFINKALLVNWVVPFSSDGYASFGLGNQLTSDGYCPNGFSNPGSWCVLSKVIGNQQYQFSLQNDGYMGFRVKYSKFGFHTSPYDLTVSPTAPDQQILLGGGTDRAPVYQQILGGVFNFNMVNVFISVETSVNQINFTLQPPPLVPVVTPPPKPVINKILK
jgi:hypothetical protein